MADGLKVEMMGETAVIHHIFTDQPAEFAQQVGQYLQKKQPCVVLLGVVGQPATLLLSSIKDHHMGEWLKQALTMVEGKGGGGRPFAQAKLSSVTQETRQNVIKTTLKQYLS